MSKTNPIDPNVPAGSEDPKLGDNRIRNLAAGVAELQNVDHYMGTDGGAGTGYNEDAAGEHSKATLRVQASKPTAASGKGFIYAKTVGGVVELFYEDQAGKEIQITANGILNSLNLTGNQTVDGVKTFSKQAAFTLGLTTAKAMVSTLAKGTAPLTVVSATKIENLNADKVDGKDIDSILGAWSTKIFNTNYLAASDGFVCAVANGAGGNYDADIRGYTDGSNPPTTKRTASIARDTFYNFGITMPVKKGDYWKVILTVWDGSTQSSNLYWIPIGA